MIEVAVETDVGTLETQDWPEVDLPPDDLPDSDGEPMESPWHRDAATLLKAGYIAARGGRMDDFFVGCNMFLYFSEDQIQNQDFKGPDFFIVNDVDGSRARRFWAVWKETGRYPDVIVELLSKSTEKGDMTDKKTLYERTFHTHEYFCLAPEMARMIGWRLEGVRYHPIAPDGRCWLFSKELNLWLGTWHGEYLGLEATWPRWYTPTGELVLLPEEAERQRAEIAEAARASAEERASTAEERASTAEERASTAEERAARLAARLRELGIEPEVD